MRSTEVHNASINVQVWAQGVEMVLELEMELTSLVDTGNILQTTQMSQSDGQNLLCWPILQSQIQLPMSTQPQKCWEDKQLSSWEQRKVVSPQHSHVQR